MEPKSNKSKTLTKIILGVTVLLAFVSIGTAYYFFQIKDVSPTDTTATNGCGCYFVQADEKITSCSTAKPENAFEFRTGFIGSDGKCSATCDPRTAATISSSQAAPTILGCEVSEFPSTPGCIDLAIKNSEGERIAEGIAPTDAVTVEATFAPPSSVTSGDTDYYDGFSFTINGEKIDIDKTSAETTGSGGDIKYTVSTQVTDYGDAEKLSVQAFGASATNTEVTSLACLRTVAIVQPKVASCTAIDANLTSDAQPKVADILLDITTAEAPSSLAVKFKLGTNGTTITTKDVLSKLVDGTIVLDEDFLYDTDNYTSSNSFSVLNSETTKYAIEATILINGTAVDSKACTTSIDLPEEEVPSGEEPGGEEPSGEEPSGEEPSVTSSFLTSKTASKQCLERTSPNNSVSYTITIDNLDAGYQDVLSVKDKLPLGFAYTAGSTEIDGTAVADNDIVTVTTVGSTQEIVWEQENGWSIQDGKAMTITFGATVTTTALTGSNLNEVIVTPLNTPTDDTKLRSQVAVEVAQSCTAPETALFDSNLAKAVLGLMIVALAASYYYSKSSDRVTEKVLTSGVYKGLKLLGLKLTEPRKYFEEKSIRSMEKKRKKKS
ncbi:hypothetical protein HYV12_04150 [Candidatus Dojkabacteria bacterium]|nr:hypothetical protein [Candidatus Dojkabacteria bacterium]